jgi:hypothetical protein
MFPLCDTEIMDIPSVCFPIARDAREELLGEKRVKRGLGWKRGKPAIETVIWL